MLQQPALRDLETFVTNRHLDAQLTADCLDVFAESVNLSALDISMFDTRHAVLTDLQPPREIHLRELGCFVQFTKTISATGCRAVSTTDPWPRGAIRLARRAWERGLG